jgi:hypothetical protein
MTVLSDLADRTVFPGRVRQFAHSDPGVALALAVGCAWAETPRGGHAAAVVPAAARSDPLVIEALALAGRLGLGNLALMPAIDLGISVEELAPRERQPVRLGSLGRDLVPRWPAGTTSGLLSACAAVEPLLFLPGRDARWRTGPAAFLALAWIASEGRRVVWELPPGAPLTAWEAAADLVAHMQFALKLIVDPADLPWSDAFRHWWIAAPGPADAAGVLTWALAGEECALLALPAQATVGESWLPGSTRVLADAQNGTVLCLARDAVAASTWAAQRGLGVLQLTGLRPLPGARLRAARAPLVAWGEDLARHLAPLAALDPGLRCTLAPAIHTAH